MRIEDKLSSEQKMILKLLSKTGGMNHEQVKAILRGMEEHTVFALMNYMLSNSLVEKQDNYYVVNGEAAQLNRDNVGSMWVALNEIKSRSDLYSLRVECETFYITVGNEHIYQIVPIRMNNLIRLRELQIEYNNRFGEKDVDYMSYILVIEEPKILEKLEEYNLTFNHKIALLEYKNIEQKPVISIYQPS